MKQAYNSTYQTIRPQKRDRYEAGAGCHAEISPNDILLKHTLLPVVLLIFVCKFYGNVHMEL